MTKFFLFFLFCPFTVKCKATCVPLATKKSTIAHAQNQLKSNVVMCVLSESMCAAAKTRSEGKNSSLKFAP